MTEIKIHHLTRVEGHGDLEIHREEMKSMARFAVVEAPRFFEALLLDQDFREVTHIVSRICGICAVSHKCAALKATEAAMDVAVSDQVRHLRRLAFNGEIISSHVLHIYFLAGPDFMNVPGIFPLLKTDQALVQRAVRLKGLGYALCDTVAGRHTHPVAMTVGGFSFVHSSDQISGLKKRLEQALADLNETVGLFKAFQMPEVERETEYVCLTHPDHYALYDGDLYSSEGPTVSVQDYKAHVRERVEPYSNAKHAQWHRPSYMVGALARFNNNYDQLLPLAKEAAADLGLKQPCFNPFKITTAQIVECIHCVEDSLNLIDSLTVKGVSSENVQSDVHPRAGTGVGAVEAPRGTLFHEFKYDDNGKCTFANLVIPTAQNLGNLEADLQAYLPLLNNMDDDTLARHMQMLVRAYDPCISCATH